MDSESHSDSQSDEISLPEEFRRSPSSSSDSQSSQFSYDSDSESCSSGSNATVDSKFWEEAQKTGTQLVLDGYSAEEYAQNLQSSIALYKCLAIRDENNHSPYMPFLRRNLWYMNENNLSPTHRKVPAPLPKRSTRQKRVNLILLIDALKTKQAIEEELVERHNFKSPLSISQLASYWHLRDAAVEVKQFLASPSTCPIPVDFMTMMLYEDLFQHVWNNCPLTLTLHSFQSSDCDQNASVTISVQPYEVIQYSMPSIHARYGSKKTYTNEAIHLRDYRMLLNENTEPVTVDLTQSIKKAKESNAEAVYIVLVFRTTESSSFGFGLDVQYRDELYTVMNVWERGDHHTGCHFTNHTDHMVYNMPPTRRNDRPVDPVTLVNNKLKFESDIMMAFSIRSGDGQTPMNDPVIEPYIFEPFSGEYKDKVLPFYFANYKFPTIPPKRKRCENAWLGLPIKYQFCYGVEVCDSDEYREVSEPSSPSATHDEVSSIEEEETITIEPVIMATMQNDPLVCIICKATFASFRQLLIHYNASYPRLQFTPSIEQTSSNPIIDVLLNPTFRDIDEVSKRAPSEEMVFIADRTLIKHVRYIAKQEPETLSLLSIDNTYIHPDNYLRVGDIPDGRYYKKRYHEEQSDEIYFHPIPLPNSNLDIAKSRKRLFDFVDVSYYCKVYMFTWNSMILKIGRNRSIAIGDYSLLKLYIHTHRPLLEKMPQLVKAIETDILKGTHIDGCSDMGLCNLDLLKRIHSEEYDPRVIVNGEHTPAMIAVQLYLNDLHNDYVLNRDKPGRVFHKLSKQKPSWTCSETLFDDINELLESDLIDYNHEIRKLWQQPEDILKPFGFTTVPESLFDIPLFPNPRHQNEKKVEFLEHRRGWFSVPRHKLRKVKKEEPMDIHELGRILIKSE